MSKRLGGVILFSILLLSISFPAMGEPQTPQDEEFHIVAAINTNHIYARNIEPNADVAFKIFEPGNPDAVYEDTLHSFGKTEYYLPHSIHQVDLEEGYRVVLFDAQSLPEEKELTLVAIDVTDFVVGTTIVGGTANVPEGTVIEGHVSDDWIDVVGFTATVDSIGEWEKDLYPNFSISERTSLEVWTEAGDDDGDRTQYEINYDPLYVTAAINTNHIYVRNIESNADVTFQIYEPGNPVPLFDETMPSSGGTGYFLAQFQHEVDLLEGYQVVVTDESTNETKELTLVAIEVTTFEDGTTIVGGTANVPEGTVIEGSVFDEWPDNIHFTTTTDVNGDWLKDLTEYEPTFSINEQSNIEVWTEAGDEDGDRTQYELLFSPIGVSAYYGTDILTANECTPNGTITVKVFEDSNQIEPTFGPESWTTPSDGRAIFPLWQYGFDLLPGMVIKVEDVPSGVVKILLVSEFSGSYDEDGNRLHGIATPDKEIHFEIGRVDDPPFYTSTTSDPVTGEWEIYLDPYELDGWAGWIFDEDGDATKPDKGEDPPHARIFSYLHHDKIYPLTFVPDSDATIEIFNPDNLITPVYSEMVQLNQWGNLDSTHELDGFDLIPNMVVSIEDFIYDGTARTVTMTVDNLSITDFDPETNAIQGFADANAEVRLRAYDESSSQQVGPIIADSLDGSWNHSFDPVLEITLIFANIEDDARNLTRFYITGNDFLQMVDASGDTLTATDDQGDETIVEIPAGAVAEEISLAYIPREPSDTPDGFSFVGSGFDLNAYQDGVLVDQYDFQEPITITLEYSEEDVENIEEESLILYYWDQTSEQWIDAAETCDPVIGYQRFPAEFYLEVTICHLSKFALIGENQYMIYFPLSVSP